MKSNAPAILRKRGRAEGHSLGHRLTDLTAAQSGGLVLAVAAAAGVLILGLRMAGTLEVVELALYDRALRSGAAPGAAPDVVAIPIGEADLETWGWPIPDGRLAEIASRALDAGAAAVGIDIYRDRPVAPGTDALTSVLSDRRVVAIYKLATSGADPGVAPPPAAGDRAGFSDVPMDQDGAVRRIVLVVSDDAGVHQSLALRLAGLTLKQKGLRGQPDHPDVLMLGGTPVPRLSHDFGPYAGIDSSGYQIALRFQHPPSSVRRIPALDIVDGRAGPEALSGKVALIGIAGSSVKDSFRTPGGGASDALGIEVHAAAVQELIDLGRDVATPLGSAGPLTVRLATIAAALAGSIAGLVSRTFVSAILLGPGVALALAAVLNQGPGRGVWLPTLPAALAWLLAFLGISVALALIARKRQAALDRLFATHLSPALAREVWHNRTVLLAGGRPVPRRLFATVLFADLVGSTRTGGTAEPGAFMDWIGECLARLGEVAQTSGGFVEKYTGDGIMVVFGAPVPSLNEADQQQDAARACACAWAMGEAVTALNAGGRPLAPYRLRIGLNSGPVVGGTIGVAGSLRYNVIGDTANFAARVESFGKRLSDAATRDVTICLTEETARLAGGGVSLVPVGRLAHDDGLHEAEIFLLTGCSSITGSEDCDGSA